MLGRTRARQDELSGDVEKKVVPVLIHGDAAFAGQGVVAEILQMSGLDGYQIGGTIHVVTNNQLVSRLRQLIDARSTPYCTDVARMLAVPIFHVNGEDIDGSGCRKNSCMSETNIPPRCLYRHVLFPKNGVIMKVTNHLLPNLCCIKIFDSIHQRKRSMQKILLRKEL